MLGLPDPIRACLFDLDGVLTDTASVHRKAWKTTFDEFLAHRAEQEGARFTPFTDADYEKYVDGKKRQDGARAFLASRGITLTEGTPDDAPELDTVNGVGNRKNEVFHRILRREGVEVFAGSRRYLEAVQAAGWPAAVVSSSSNTHDVLQVTGLNRYVCRVVDGVTMQTENIPGKPAPDSFLRAAQLLTVHARQAAVFEDALAGVQAGHRGHFGCVVGVDRVGHADTLRHNGADVVVTDLADLLEVP